MPSPPKTSDEQIIAAARKLVERQGRDGFSMKDVAAAVGIRAPSLYGRFADRAQILARVEIGYWQQLEEDLTQVARGGATVDVLVGQARAYRTFAKKHPEGYALMFDPRAGRTVEGTQARAKALAPTLPGFMALVGQDHALLAARVMTPFLHGFVSMELVGAFRLGGGLDEAFEHGVTTILAGLRRAGAAVAAGSRRPVRTRSGAGRRHAKKPTR